MTNNALKTLSAMRTQIALLGTLIYFNAARAVFGEVDRRAVFLGAAFFILLQAGYAYDKLAYSAEDRLNGVSSARRFTWPARLLLLVSLPAVFYISSFGPLRWILVLMAIVMPLYSLETGRYRLKAIPVLKPVLNTALLFSVSVLPPILLKHGAGGAVICNAAVSSWQVLVLIFVLTVTLDIRDVAGDRAAGIPTIPVMLGEKFTVAILGCGLAVTAFVGLKAGAPALAAISFVTAAFLVPTLWRKDRGYYELLLLALNMLLAGKWIFG